MGRGLQPPSNPTRPCPNHRVMLCWCALMCRYVLSGAVGGIVAGWGDVNSIPQSPLAPALIIT